jgi:hypothetical protein
MSLAPTPTLTPKLTQTRLRTVSTATSLWFHGMMLCASSGDSTTCMGALSAPTLDCLQRSPFTHLQKTSVCGRSRRAYEEGMPRSCASPCASLMAVGSRRGSGEREKDEAEHGAERRRTTGREEEGGGREKGSRRKGTSESRSATTVVPLELRIEVAAGRTGQCAPVRTSMAHALTACCSSTRPAPLRRALLDGRGDDLCRPSTPRQAPAEQPPSVAASCCCSADLLPLRRRPLSSVEATRDADRRNCSRRTGNEQARLRTDPLLRLRPPSTESNPARCSNQTPPPTGSAHPCRRRGRSPCVDARKRARCLVWNSQDLLPQLTRCRGAPPHREQRMRGGEGLGSKEEVGGWVRRGWWVCRGWCGPSGWDGEG